MKMISTVFLVLILSGCGFFAKKPTEDKNPLCVTECPAELPLLTDDSFGAAMGKMIEWANVYHSCRKACQAWTK